jgi:cytoskeleton protein RodZ
MESLGLYLKTQREKKSIRLEEIASITKIQLHNLELLEKGNWESLPPEPFIRGFILAYAKYVGLSAAEVLEKYEQELGIQIAPTQATNEPSSNGEGADEAGRAVPPDQLVQAMKPPPTRKIVFAVIGISLFLLIARLSTFGKKVSEENAAKETSPVAANVEAPPAPEVVAAQALPAEKSQELPVASPMLNVPAGNSNERIIASQKEIPAPAVPANPAVPVKDPSIKHEIEVTVAERSWSKVVIDDQMPVQKTLKKGEKVSYQAKEKIKIVLGNSEGAELLHNGEKVEGKVYQGVIRYYIFPQGARFPQDPPKPRVITSDTAAEERPPETAKEPMESSGD